MGAPIGHTCPDIDRVKDRIEEACGIAEDLFKNIEDRTEEEKEEAFKDIANGLWGLDDVMEELRTSNETLRTWGYEMEQDREHFESEFDIAEKEISDLEDQIRELENELNQKG